MLPLAKESVGIGAATQHALAQQFELQPKQPADQTTSAAAPIEIPVQVFGSHATVADKPLQTEPFSEKTNTIIILPRGGVLRMATAVNVGQMLVVTSLKSRKDVICRVTRVRSSSNAQAYVEVEFIQPNPTYWGVNFVSKPEPNRPEAASLTPPTEQKVAPKALCASAGVSAMPSRRARFIVGPSFGTEQSVSVSNRETSVEVPPESQYPSPEDSTAIDTLTAPTGNESVHQEVTAEAFTDIADTIRLAFVRACNAGIERGTSQSHSHKRTFVAACAVLLFALVAGFLYFYPKAQVPTVATNAATSPLQQMPVAPSVVPLHPSPVSVSRDSVKNHGVVLRRPAQPRQLMPVLRALKMPPRPSQPAMNPQTSAPTISVPGSAQPTELLGIASSSIRVTPPTGPIAVGGAVKEPKLIAARLPVYPPFAKQAHVQGDVVIDTQIDTDGRVMQAKVVSGPVMLRQAALDALRTWKYEPPLLDGQPIQVETFVMIKFRL